MSYTQYRNSMIKRFWDYSEKEFPEFNSIFDPAQRTVNRPPVFLKEHANRNVLSEFSPPKSETSDVNEIIPQSGRHKWFRSMNSSQALALSVFGNLKDLGRIELLEGLECEGGAPLLPAGVLLHEMELEHDVSTLGEPRPTSIDVYFPGDFKVAIECKMTEQEIGTCSRPGLKPDDDEYCDGSYTQQKGREKLCALSEKGILYWDYIPKVFKWDSHKELDSCPLNETYQLVRNILAVLVDDLKREVEPKGHCALLYDDRNPNFRSDGKAGRVYERVKENLLDRSHLQRCSWQYLIKQLESKGLSGWLMDGLEEKYGLGS